MGASMGPSTFVDGDPMTAPSSSCSARCFNGAIDFRRRRRLRRLGRGCAGLGLQWCHRLSSTETPTSASRSSRFARFNGAMGKSKRDQVVLQWGHRSSSTGTRRMDDQVTQDYASMGLSAFVDGDCS